MILRKKHNSISTKTSQNNASNPQIMPISIWENTITWEFGAADSKFNFSFQKTACERSYGDCPVTNNLTLLLTEDEEMRIVIKTDRGGGGDEVLRLTPTKMSFNSYSTTNADIIKMAWLEVKMFRATAKALMTETDV